MSGRRTGRLKRRRSLLFTAATVFAIAGTQSRAQDCTVTPSSSWKSAVVFPDDPFRFAAVEWNQPSWIKFTILTCDPTTVYFQNGNEYLFHYEFAVARLDPFFGMSLADFELATLYAQGKEAIVGAIVLPWAPYPPSPPPPEYGIQLVGRDPYDPQTVVDIFNLVVSAVDSEPGVQAYYFPTYEQGESAAANKTFLESHGIEISSADRWATGNTCYAEGWALGELKYFEGSAILDAYLMGLLGPEDILLTDGVPAEVPPLAGIVTLTASTPNSHAAILAQTFQIPFAHLALADDADKAQQLIGRKIALRGYHGGFDACDVRLIDVEDALSDQQIAEILVLKEPPALNIAQTATYGAYGTPTDGLVQSDIAYFGGKAANFGFLRRSIPNRCPLAAAISFDLWNEFLGQTLASGGTLRDEISSILSGYDYPPSDMFALSSELRTIRDTITDAALTTFTSTQRSAIIAILQDPQYDFDQYQKIRFRSSTNVEDSEQFTGAGLYDSYSGCLADELDGDAARYVSAWPCDAAIGMDDNYAWSLSSVGDMQSSHASAHGDVGNPGTFTSPVCPTGACCVEGSCTEMTHSECVRTHAGSYQNDGTNCASTSCPQPSEGQMRITEYMYSGNGGEFIEFSNVGTSSIDMTGWSYDDASAVAGTVDLTAFGVVDPGESVILTEDPATTFAVDWGCPEIAIIGGLTANIGRNDEVNLYDALDGQVDCLTYGDEDFPGSIRARYASGWPCDLTVGANSIYGWSPSVVGDIQNSYASAGGDVGSPGSFVSDPCPTGACCSEASCIEATRGNCISVHGGLYQGDGTNCGSTTCPQPSEEQMRITEYMSAGGGGEFIEFTNLGAEPVDMIGWSYDDESGLPGTVNLSAFGLVSPGQSVILTEDPAATFESDWGLSGVTIIGGLTVNLGNSDVIQLYDASDTLVDRLAYHEDEGPSQCDPTKAEEQGVFSAIRKVFASFYNDNAFLERLRHNINENEVGMAMLVHHSFPDEIELANGVATLERNGILQYADLVTQLGAVSVANPTGGSIPEEVYVYGYGSSSGDLQARLERGSSLVLLGATVMEWDGDYLDLGGLLGTAADQFALETGKSSYILDFEYKLVAPGGQALPGGGLVVKQLREIPQFSATPHTTPFLINEPTEYCIFQGDWQNVFASHRLKSRWVLETENYWMTEENLSGRYFTTGEIEYTDGCRQMTIDGPMDDWPDASYTFTPAEDAATAAWTFQQIHNPRAFALEARLFDWLLPSGSPLLTIRDHGWPFIDHWSEAQCLEAQIEYAAPVPTGYEGAPTTTTDYIQLCSCLQEQAGDLLQERTINGPDGLSITTSFYWPTPKQEMAGYTAPLSRWVETVIEGLTATPIILHDWYAQTYGPGHHNLVEDFIFDPFLDPDVPESSLDELRAQDIRLIHVRYYGPSPPHPEPLIDFYGHDGSCATPTAIPASSRWGLAVLFLLLLIAMILVEAKRQASSRLSNGYGRASLRCDEPSTMVGQPTETASFD